MDKLTLHVPATTANLGPGFDCLGLALQIWNRIEVEPARGEDRVEWREDTGARRIDPAPFDPAKLSTPSDNLILLAMDRAYQALRRQRPRVHLAIYNRIPLSRGLGSSAAAVAAGLLAANEWNGRRLRPSDLLRVGTELEGHPDNVSAALLGGLTISAIDGEQLACAHFAPPRGWRAALYIPTRSLATRRARAVLPARVPRADAIFNVGRAALLVHAFESGDASALDLATRDRLHQPYRARIIPGLQEILDAARKAGAAGAALSGAGTTLIAFCSTANGTRDVAAAMSECAAQMDIQGAARVVGLSSRGAWLEHGG